MDARAARFKRGWLSAGSLVALALGFAAGAWGHRSGSPFATEAAAFLSALGGVWVNALRMVVLPLVVAQLVHILALAGGSGKVGRVTSTAFAVFGTLLIVAATFTFAFVPPILERLEFSPEALTALRDATAPISAPALAAARTPAEWLTGVVPANVFRAATQDDLLGLVIFSVAFGLALGRMPAARREPVAELFRTVAEAMTTIVGWIVWLMPLAVFSLAFSAAVNAGAGAIAIIATFVVLLCSVLFAFTLLQYPIAALFGGVSVRRFAAATLPVQIVAAGTRSSIASLPLLLDRARTCLGLRAEVSTVVMPLAVSTFKVNKAISSPLQFLFLAHVYGIELSIVQLVTFTALAIVLSFTTLGIPSGGSLMRSAPLYIAAGIPIQGYLLTEAADSIPDIFKTLVNVTGNMTAAAIVNRVTASPESQAAAVPDPIGEIAAGV